LSGKFFGRPPYAPARLARGRVLKPRHFIIPFYHPGPAPFYGGGGPFGGGWYTGINVQGNKAP
jgi:hypothetical protein